MDTEDHSFIDFLEKCLEWDVDQRLDPEKALNHEWILEGLKEIVSMSDEKPDET